MNCYEIIYILIPDLELRKIDDLIIKFNLIYQKIQEKLMLLMLED